MQRLRNLNEIYQKRLLRPTYAHHQATPYLVILDSTLRNADGSVHVPASGDTTPLSTRTATVATLLGQNTVSTTGAGSIMPGTVLVRTSGENVGVATGSQTVAEQPFGLLGNWIGGDFDDIGAENEVACWRGPDSTYTLLAPGFNDTGSGNTNGQSLSAALTAVAGTGKPVALYGGTDGRLFSCSTPTGTMVVVAHLIDRPAASRIVIDLKV